VCNTPNHLSAVLSFGVKAIFAGNISKIHGHLRDTLYEIYRSQRLNWFERRRSVMAEQWRFTMTGGRPCNKFEFLGSNRC
jgi:hypothetical protein